MRWVGEKIPSLLRRMQAVASSIAKPTSRIASTTRTRLLSTAAAAPVSLSAELGIAEEIHTILDTVPDIEAPLDFLAPLLSPHIVTAVLGETRTVCSGFRFFVWASRRKRLRSWVSHNLMISMLRGGGFDSAWESLIELRSSGAPIASPAFEVLISAYAAEGMTEKAVEAFERMVPEFGCRPNTFTYNTLLQIMVQEGVSLLALALYSLMLKRDCRPNRSTFIILIDSLCKTGKSSDALAMFDELSQRGISPNTMVYTVVLSGLCRANRIADANMLLDSMKQNRFRPDSVTYNALLDGFCKLGSSDEAFKLLNWLRGEGFVLGLNAFSSLINGLFRAGNFEEACRCYRTMLEEKVVPDCIFYTIMIKGYIEAGKVKEAFSFLGEMTDRGIIPDTFCYNTLIKGLCDIGLLDSARSLKLEISNNNCFPDAATYTIMICGLCNEGLVHEAQKIFEEMGKFGCVPTVVTFNALIDGLCKAKRLEEARILFYVMETGRNPFLYIRLSQGPNPVFDRDSFHRSVEQLCESGHIVEAYRLIRSLADSGAVPDIITYNILINGFCKAKDMDMATLLFMQLRQKGYTPDAVTYATLIDGHRRVNRVDKAIEVFENMVSSRCEPIWPSYNTIMKALCKMKRVWQAVTLWLNYISKKQSLSVEEAENIAAAWKHSEQRSVGEAVRCLVEMSLKCDFHDPLPYTRWLVGFCQAGQLEEAFEIYAVLTGYNVDVTSLVCARLIRCFCWGGKVDLAMDVMLYSLKKGILFERHVGNRLLKYLWDQNKKKEALKLACQMSHAGYVLDIYLRRPMKDLLHNYNPHEG